MDYLHRIADFITGKLSPQEAEKVKQKIETNSEWAEEAAIQEDILFAAIEVKKIQLRTQFDRIEANLQSQTKQGLVAKITGFKSFVSQQVEYSLEQLTALFTPVPQYQPLLAMPMRGHDIKVLMPDAGIDCFNEGLSFQLSKGSEFPLEVVVENNQCEEIYAQEIDSNTTDFTLFFPAREHPPGRYYWKLMLEEEMIMSEFFIAKEALSKLS